MPEEPESPARGPFMTEEHERGTESTGAFHVQNALVTSSFLLPVQ